MVEETGEESSQVNVGVRTRVRFPNIGLFHSYLFLSNWSWSEKRRVFISFCLSSRLPYCAWSLLKLKPISWLQISQNAQTQIWNNIRRFFLQQKALQQCLRVSYSFIDCFCPQCHQSGFSKWWCMLSQHILVWMWIFKQTLFKSGMVSTKQTFEVTQHFWVSCHKLAYIVQLTFPPQEKWIS